MASGSRAAEPVSALGSLVRLPQATDWRKVLRRLFAAAVDAADPRKVIAAHLPPPPSGRCVVVGAGKATVLMAAAVEAAWPHVNLTGVVVAPYGHGAPCARIRVFEAAHPVPDANSVEAARHMLDAVRNLGPDDLVLSLMSGGGSATLCLPAPGLTLEDKQTVNRLLLASGLDIRTMNAVRRRISAVKGGRLALAASPAPTVTLAISDIPGDDPVVVGSGPTAPDPTARLDLSDVVGRLGPDLPPAAAAILSAPPADARPELQTTIKLIAAPMASLEAAARAAQALDIIPVIVGDDLEGESSDLARAMAAMALQPVTRPTLYLSGGETTVTLAGKATGRGGRNTEFLLSLACELDGAEGVWAIAADTDGEDGAAYGAAGAVIGPDTLRRARETGLRPDDYLARHDSGTLFAALGDLVRTGPTLTNVNDFRAVLALPKRR